MRQNRNSTVRGIRHEADDLEYDGFDESSPSLQKNYAYRLSIFGSADEVWEIAEALDFNNSAFAARFLEKALFRCLVPPVQVLEMVAMVD